MERCCVNSQTKRPGNRRALLALTTALLVLVSCDRLMGQVPADTVDTAPASTEGASEHTMPQAVPTLSWDWPARNPAGWTFSRTGHQISWPEGGGIGLRTPADVEEPDVHMRSPALSIAGADYPTAVVDFECVENCVLDPERIELMLYYTTPSHSETIRFSGLPLDVTPLAAGERRKLVYDMTNLARGGTDWIESEITQVRFDLPRGQDAVYIVRSIKICHKSDTSC